MGDIKKEEEYKPPKLCDIYGNELEGKEENELCTIGCAICVGS